MMSIRVIAQTDPFDTTSRIIKEYTDCKTIKGIFRKLKIKYKEVPVTVSINGVIVTDWTTKVKDKDLVLIKIVPTGAEGWARGAGIAQIIAGIAVGVTGNWVAGGYLIFGGVTTFFMPELSPMILDAYIGDASSGDSVIAPTTKQANYLRGGTNSYGHNKPIPVLLGTHRIYPYQIAHPFTKYIVNSSPTVTIGDPGEFDADALNELTSANSDLNSHTNLLEHWVPDISTYITLAWPLLDLFRNGTATWEDVASFEEIIAVYTPHTLDNGLFAAFIRHYNNTRPVGESTQVTSYIANPPTQQLHQVFLWGHEDIDIIDTPEGRFKREDTDVVKAGNPSITTNSLPYYGNETIKQVSIYKSMSPFDPEDTSIIPEIPDGATAHQVILPLKITELQVSIAIGKFMVVMNSGELETPKTEIEWKLWDITEAVAVVSQTDIALIQGGETHQAMTQEMTAVNLDITNLDGDKAYRLDIWRNFDDVKDETCKFYKSNVTYASIDITLSHILCTSNYPLMSPEANIAYKYSDFMTQDDTIEGAVDNFNAICQTNIMDYNGTGTGAGAWSKRRTNNPASMYLYILQGKPNKRPVSDAEIDWAMLEEWHTFCDVNNFECNAVLTNPGAIENILAMIALSGRATTNNNQLYSVIIDQPQDFPKQLITNVNSFNMGLSRTFNDDVHAIYFSFINKETGYQSDERAVYADGYTAANATNIISQDLPCITNPNQVFNMGKFMLNCYNRRVETVQVSMDAEYLLAQVGDLVNVSYDQLLLGLARGRVTQVITDGGGLTTDLVLDTDVTMELGTDYAIVVRLTDGTFLKEGTTTTIPIQNTDNTTNTVTLVTPQITSVESMNLVSFGPSESVVGEYTVNSIASGADITATLTLVNYDEDVYAVGAMPPWESNVATPSDFGSSPILEKVYDVDAIALQAESNSKKLADLYDPGLKTSIKTSTPSATLIRSDCLSVAVSGTTLYFIDKDNLHVYKAGLTAGATRTEIVAEAVKSIAIGYDDRYLLYTAMSNDSMIYKVGLSTGAVSQVTTVASQLPKVLDSNFVTYINYEDGQKLYKVNYLETASTGELLLDYNVNSYGIFGTNCIWSDADTQQTYIKKITDNAPTNKGIVYDYGMLYNIIATAPSFWSYPGKDAIAVHIDLGSLKSKTLQDDFFGDVVQHTANKDGRYVMVTSGGDTYTTTFAPEDLQNTLDTEVSTEVVDIACSTQYLDNRLYNISVADIVKIVFGDKITGDGIQEGSTVIYVGSNYVTLSQYAITTDASASVSVEGTRLFLNANKVVVPGTISAGLVESDFYNSQSRVSDTAPVVENRGEPFYKFDAISGLEQQFDVDGNLIRQFTADDGLWLRAGISVGGIAPYSGVDVPLVPDFTNTQNEMYVQDSYPTTAEIGETWFVTNTDVVHETITYSEDTLYRKLSESPDAWEATSNASIPGDIYRLATNPPTAGTQPSLKVGDQWFNTDTVYNALDTYQAQTLYVLVSVTPDVWQELTPTNTQALLDGAELGKTAEWDTVTGTSKPEDNATNTPNIYRQGTVPTGSLGVADLWACTADVSTYLNGRTYSYTGTTWAEATPTDLSSLDPNESAKLNGIESGATNTPNIFRQDTAPTATKVGDLWACTLTATSYIANVTYSWSGSAWERASATSLSELDTSQNDKLNGIELGATNTAPVFRQGTVPSGVGEVNGSFWACTAFVSGYRPGRTYAYNGTTWIEATPASLFELDTVKSDKLDGISPGATINVFVKQATKPSTANAGDLWACTNTHTDGQTYYDNTTYKFVTGTTWEAMGATGAESFSTNTPGSFVQDAIPTGKVTGTTWVCTLTAGIYNSGSVYILESTSPDVWTVYSVQSTQQPTVPTAPHIMDTWFCTADITTPIAFKKGVKYWYDGNSWEASTDGTYDYLKGGGNAESPDGTASSWTLNGATGKLTCTDAHVHGNIEAESGYFHGVVEVISTDLLTRTVVDDGNITFYTRVLSTDAWSSIGTLGGGYNGITPVLVAPQDFMIGDMTVGRGGGNLNNNVALGVTALVSNTTGTTNVAVGFRTLFDNLTGENNVGIGAAALISNTDGDNNVAIGSETLQSNLTGFDNVAIGTNALSANILGINNVGIGHLSLETSISSFNTAVGDRSLSANTTGVYNTALGVSALIDTQIGSYNTAIGAWASSNDVYTGNNNITLGFAATPSAIGVSGECTLGHTNINTLRCNSQTILGLSDRRDKTDIKVNPFGLVYLMDLKPIDFLWKTRDGNAKDGTRALGFIAQELLETEEKFDAAHVNSVYTENPDRIEAAYSALLPIMVKAIQEQQELIEKLTSRLNILESK